MPIFVSFKELEIFHDRLGPGRWNWGNHIKVWNLVAWCKLPWNGSLYVMATLSLCLHFLIWAGGGCCPSLNILYMMPGWSWGAILGTWMEVRHHLAGVLTQIHVFGHGFRWYATCNLDGGETWILGPGWSWELSWMEVRCKSVHLNGGGMVHKYLMT